MKQFQTYMDSHYLIGLNILFDLFKENLFSIKIGFYLHFEFLELFKGFLYVFHKIHVSLSTDIISKSNEMINPTFSLCIHCSIYIIMYETQYISLIQCVKWKMIQLYCLINNICIPHIIQNQMISKFHHYGVLIYFLVYWANR